MSTALLLLPAAALGFVAGALLKAGARRLARGLPPSSGGPWWHFRIAESLTALVIAAVVAARHGDSAELVLGLVLVAFLVPISLIDLDQRVIPNGLTMPAALLAVTLGLTLDPAGEPERLIAGVVAGAALAIPSLLRPRGIGMGDAKLLAVLGLYLGTAVGAAFVAAFLAGSVAGVMIMATRGVAEGRRTAIPFGPFLGLGGVVALLAGDAIVRGYLSAF